MVESIFIINLFRDTNIAHIFYKFSQTYGMETKSDNYFWDGESMPYTIKMKNVMSQ